MPTTGEDIEIHCRLNRVWHFRYGLPNQRNCVAL